MTMVASLTTPNRIDHDRFLFCSSQAVDVRVLADNRSHGSGGLPIRSQREDVGKQYKTTLPSRTGQIFRANYHDRGLFRGRTFGRGHKCPGRRSRRSKHRKLFLQRKVHSRWSTERKRLSLWRSCVCQLTSFQQSRS